MTIENRLEGKVLTSDNIKEKVSSDQITLGAVMLISGMLLIFAVGFSEGPGGILHNAAHDTRHAVTIPCH